MKKSRFTYDQTIANLKQGEAGTPVPELCRCHGISSPTYYKWRSKYGGMDTSMMSRVKELEQENARLKKMYAEAQMSADILKEAMAKKGVSPSQRREMAMGSSVQKCEHPTSLCRFQRQPNWLPLSAKAIG